MPGNYVPPDFVVNALQRTNVQCTWETGDQDRERILTQVSSGGYTGDHDDLNVYLATTKVTTIQTKRNSQKKYPLFQGRTTWRKKLEIRYAPKRRRKRKRN